MSIMTVSSIKICFSHDVSSVIRRKIGNSNFFEGIKSQLKARHFLTVNCPSDVDETKARNKYK